jgi:adenosine deaminase
MDASFRDWPKIDLHRHLEGAIRIDTIRELALREQLELPYADRDAFNAVFRVTEQDERSLIQFISKFIWLRKLIADQETLARLTYEAVEDAALDHVIYLELRFNYSQLLRRGIPGGDIGRALVEGVDLAQKKYPIDVGLICGISRELPLACAEDTVDFAIRHAENGIVAVDLMNDESYPPELFGKPFERARAAGLHATVHAGEAAGPLNIVNAIRLLGAERIGHGTHILWGEGAAQVARSHNAMIECCLTSNLQTGAIDEIHQHPIVALRQGGIPVCLNTDDPGVSDIDLTHEYQVAHADLGIGPDELREILSRTVEHIFRPDLKAKLKNKLDTFFTTPWPTTSSEENREPGLC